MIHFRISKSIKNLLKEGMEMATSNKKLINKTQVKLWLAELSDILTNQWSEKSELFKEFKKFWGKFYGKNEDYTPSEIEEFIGTITPILSRVHQINKIKLRDPESKELEREIKLIITESYVRSPWFYIPIAIFIISVFFVITGGIQLQGLKINFRELADAAIKDTENEIDQYTTKLLERIQALEKDSKEAIQSVRDEASSRLNTELNTHIDMEKMRMKKEVDSFIDKTRRSETPSLSEATETTQTLVKDLEEKVMILDVNLSNIDGQIIELKQLIEKADILIEQDWIERFSVILDQSRLISMILFSLTVLALILSSFSIFRIRKIMKD